MALRNGKGLPLEDEDDWFEFFTKIMEFPPEASKKYSKTLSSECFTGETVIQCIDDDDMKTLLKMPLGHLKKFRYYIKPSSNTGATATCKIPTKIPCPTIKMESTQLQYDQFVFEWQRYKSHFNLTDDQAATTLFFSCSEDIRQHIRTRQSQFPKTEIWVEKDLLELIKDITTTRTSPIVHVQGFLKMKQEPDEKCQDFLRRLQVKASCCGFTCDGCSTSTAEKRVKESFILGLNNKVIQTHILKTESITPGTPLSKILTEAITLEQSILDQASLANDSPSEVCAAENSSNSEPSEDEVNALNRRSKSFIRNSSRIEKLCNGCGTKEHRFNERSSKCRAWKAKCNHCGIMGHFSKVCRKKSSGIPAASGSNVSAVELNEMSCLYVGKLSSLHLRIKVKPSTTNVPTEIDSFPDTGADICLFGPQQLRLLNIKSNQLTPCNHAISVAGGSTILATGWLMVTVMLNDEATEQKAYFSDSARRFFLSRQTCIELGIVPKSFPFPPPKESSTDSISALKPDHPIPDSPTSDRPIPDRPSAIPFSPCEANIPKLLDYLLQMFELSAFNTSKPFPKLSTPRAHIHLKPDYTVPTPAYWPASIAEHWADIVKEMIDRDVAAGILIKVPFNEPTVWCARMVVVKKRDGRPRRTVDYQSLNSQCLREPVHSESPFHTARRIPQQTWKSVIDAVDGYHSVELDEESSKLTTFITPWGRYRYLRFPQGHCSAGDAFNGRVEEILSKIQRKVRLVDDICLYDDTIEGAFWHMWDILETCAKNGIVINKSKLQFCKREVNFAGLTVNNEGVQPSKRIISAIEDFPPPTNLAKARGFFGLVNQVQWAYANCREMAPFRALVKPNATFTWTEELKELFQRCKRKIIDQVSEGVRKYNTKRATCIQTDFSKQGIGYLLLQKYCECPLINAPLCCKDGWKLVFAGSRFTQGAEQRYAPTEGELLGVAWALNHAHIFTKGCTNLIVSTDHKPLLGILNNKPLYDIKNPRIVRLKEQTLPFDFVVKYNKGKWHRGPDSLSRSPQVNCIQMLEHLCESHPTEEVENDLDCILAINAIGEEGGVSLEDVKKHTETDQTMVKLVNTIQNGFPATEHLTDPTLRNFFNVREHLWIQRGIVMFKNRVVVPKNLRQRALQILHGAHQGVEGMRSRASQSIYWPGLNLAIKQLREACQTCRTISPSQPREPICSTSPPEYPFQQICMDAFELCKQHYIAIVDKYSGWLMIYPVNQHPQCRHVIACLRTIFSTYGVPEVLFSDGGLPFQGQEVVNFLRIWKVNHKTSSASYPQGNGRAELAVKSAKRLLRDNTVNGSLNTDRASNALLQYRNTPIQHLGLSPAQMLFHRNLRDGLPAQHASLRPNKLWVIAASQREQAFAKRNKDMAARYNKFTRTLTHLPLGQDVVIQETALGNKRWLRYGTVVDRDDRKYTIRVHGSGRVITRNRKVLKPVDLDQDYLHIPAAEQNGNTSGSPVQSSSSEVQAPLSSSHDPAPVLSPTDISPRASLSGSANTAPRSKQSRMLTRLLPHNKPGLKE